MARLTPLDQHSIKRQNRRRILEALRRSGPISRATLARAVGLTKSTVSSLVQEMLEEGLLSEGAPQSVGPGRPGTRLEIRGESTLALGVELGVENTQAIVLDLNNRTHGAWNWAVSPETPLAQRLQELATEVRRRVPDPSRLLGVGLTLPGVVNERVLLYAPGLGWRNERPAEMLEALLGLPVLVENDANAAALGETFWNECQSPLLYVVLTTGLGTGLVVEGQVYRGRFGAAGELGHWLSGQARSRKEAQDAEDALSLRAMLKSYQAASGRKEDFWVLLGRAQVEDAYALAALDRLARELGRFVANLCVAFDPAVVVLGGPGAEAWPWLEAPLRQTLRDLAFLPEHAELPIKPSAFGHLAPAMGAAALVLQRFLANGGSRLRSPPTSHRVAPSTVGAWQ
ncbi:MAG: ROK family transcriptional regulator [Meiothermus sp.]|uniref:ROK family transcriptional regulator n=1 Tax=Meiothermus sp. TaxID=1955249 RepID=UPI0025EA8279|nr:ROK family transcriptional regulator [Meiothermus sp.]MCS7058276.1 ROK family transcriptional regulator [Meiothermus sp.]MCS7193572.1 ROK family transcriptional regulator [Meiothermus sp.]MCX7739838.1 ROK family transcriptional regulator [Meiothermus sp.]MDW8090585.1 ROK family transcriptional regulator [Meiothermus sp.]MDW8480501.1 ROK family transcriptional regulator [Meiothermus sp.]